MIFWERRKAVSSLYEKKTRAVCDKYQLTQMEYDILMFLHNNPDFITATDIVNIRKLTKSHVSMSLKMLEEKGYIKRYYEENNNKIAHIKVLRRAEKILQDGYKVQIDFLNTIFSGFSEEEKHQCRALLNRIYKNVENELEEAKKWNF